MVLEAVTNLPSDVVDTLTHQATDDGPSRNEETRATAAERARAADLNAALDLSSTPEVDERTAGLTAAHRDAAAADAARAGTDRSAAQLAAESFPHTAAEALGAAARPTTRPARLAGQRYEAKRPRRTL
jgi:hypothetical protein